jgi:hypothetical protein
VKNTRDEEERVADKGYLGERGVQLLDEVGRLGEGVGEGGIVHVASQEEGQGFAAPSAEQKG